MRNDELVLLLRLLLAAAGCWLLAAGTSVTSVRRCLSCLAALLLLPAACGDAG
jgi:hypothetical protein